MGIGKRQSPENLRHTNGKSKGEPSGGRKGGEKRGTGNTRGGYPDRRKGKAPHLEGEGVQKKRNNAGGGERGGKWNSQTIISFGGREKT